MPDLTTELRSMADDAARQARPLAVGELIRQGDRRRRRSTVGRSAVGLSAAGLVAAGVLGMTALAPASHHPRVQLTAWTVAKQADGDVTVSIFKLSDPAALQAKLRAEGVPASIVTNHPGPCRQYPASSALLDTVFPVSYQHHTPALVIVIRPSALPSGTGIQLAGTFDQSPASGSIAPPILVYASPQCTGT